MELNMDALQAIFTRRSIRKYTDEPVSGQALETLLKAAMYAPSARNSQPWDFVVVRDKATQKTLQGADRALHMVPQAPVCIVVCVQEGRHTGDYPGFVYQDAAAATQNILLAAHTLGLGAVWCGVYPKVHLIKRFQEVLHLPDNTTPFCIIALGHPAQTPQVPERFDASRIHYETW